MTAAVTPPRHPGWTPARLALSQRLAQGDAAYLTSLRRPWRQPVTPWPPRPVTAKAQRRASR